MGPLKADTLLRFAEPEVVLGQGTPFYCRSELDNPLTYIFSNILIEFLSKV